MNRDELIELAENPDLISGIYNYCDRWCERCPFTSRCMLYAMEEDDRDDPEAHDINSEAFWSKLAGIFKQTHEMIAAMAAEQGIDLESMDLKPVKEEKDRKRARSKSNPLSRSAQQ